MSKSILITGASSGFGLSLATNLHQQGYNVIGTSREPEKHQGKVGFKLLRLDLADENSITAFTKQLFETVDKLDVLVNNAGYMLLLLAEETPTDVGKKQFETNFWGTVKLTNAILPHFRKQKSGQIITVTSVLGIVGHPNASIYSASKHALEGYFKSLRFELNQFNIKVNMVEPMMAKTNIGSYKASSSIRIEEYDDYRKQVNAYFKNGLENSDKPETIAQAIVLIIKLESSKFRNPVGKMSGMAVFLSNNAYSMFEGTIHKSVKNAK